MPDLSKDASFCDPMAGGFFPRDLSFLDMGLDCYSLQQQQQLLFFNPPYYSCPPSKCVEQNQHLQGSQNLFPALNTGRSDPEAVAAIRAATSAATAVASRAGFLQLENLGRGDAYPPSAYDILYNNNLDRMHTSPQNVHSRHLDPMHGSLQLSQLADMDCGWMTDVLDDLPAITPEFSSTTSSAVNSICNADEGYSSAILPMSLASLSFDPEPSPHLPAQLPPVENPSALHHPTSAAAAAAPAPAPAPVHHHPPPVSAPLRHLPPPVSAPPLHHHPPPVSAPLHHLPPHVSAPLHHHPPPVSAPLYHPPPASASNRPILPRVAASEDSPSTLRSPTPKPLKARGSKRCHREEKPPKKAMAKNWANSEQMEHVRRERQRRDDMSLKISTLECLLPPTPNLKRDRASIVHDSVHYVKSLQQQVEELKLVFSDLKLKSSKPPPKVPTAVSRGDVKATKLDIGSKNDSSVHIVEYHIQIEGAGETARIEKCRCRSDYMSSLMRALEHLDLDLCRCTVTKMFDYAICIIVAKPRLTSKKVVSLSSIVATIKSAVGSCGETGSMTWKHDILVDGHHSAALIQQQKE